MDLTQSEFPSLADLDSGKKAPKRPSVNKNMTKKVIQAEPPQAPKLEKKESSDSFEDLQAEAAELMEPTVKLHMSEHSQLIVDDHV